MDSTSSNMLDTVDPMFLTEYVASERSVESRQNARGAKAGTFVLSGTLISYMIKSADFKTPATASAKPQDTKKKTKKDNPKQEYNAKIPLLFRVGKLNSEPNVCAPRDDGQPGWKVLGNLNYFEEGSAFLHAQGPRAWAVDPATGALPSDPMSVKIREYIGKDNIKVAKKWFYPSPGDEIKVNVTDSEKNNVFRQENPLCAGTLLVQPDTPLTLMNVELKVHVNLMDVEVDAKDGTSAYDDAATATADGATETPVPTLGPADGGAPEVKSKKPVRREKRLVEFARYDCTAARIADDYDPTKAVSERKHETQNPFAHNMFPMELVLPGKVRPPNSVYFYIKNNLQTTVFDDSPADLKGITLIRHADKNSRDFKSDFGGNIKPDSRVRFSVWQWHGKPSPDERYIVEIETIKASPEFWRNYGITALEPYERIIGANIELPIHVHAKLFWSRTVKHLSNDLHELGHTPANLARNLQHVRGYYTYIMTELVPDFLRFFRSGKALRLSAERAAAEFSYWETENKRTGRKSCKVSSAIPGPANPVNLLGAASPVIALGNGQRATEESEGGIYAAFTDVDLLPIFTGGTHEFYVLTSHVLTKEETATYCQTRSVNLANAADTLLDQLIERETVHYWIYAVRRDAKMAGQQTRNVEVTRPSTPVLNAAGKREREDEEPEPELEMELE